MTYAEETSLTSIDWLYISNDGVNDRRVRATNLPISVAQQAALDLKANLSSPSITTPTLTQPVINVTGDATGDVYYRNGSGAFTRLGIGSTNQVLTVISGIPSWQTPSGGGGGVALGDSPDWTGDHVWTKNGALSLPTLHVTGTWITGGTSTTTKPHVLIQTAGATSNLWDTNGTALGVNSATGFSGTLLALQVDGVTRFSVKSSGVSVLNVGSDATGDMYYRNSGGLFTRLPIGTNGWVLTVASGIPSWVAGGGGGGITNSAGANVIPKSDGTNLVASIISENSGTIIVTGTSIKLDNGGSMGVFTHANSSDRTYTFPNTTGTVPLLSLAQTWSATQTHSSSIVNSSYNEFAEISTPANPAANSLRIYAKDVAGVTKLHSLDSAGTETVFGSGGSGVALGDSPTWTGSHTWSKNSVASTPTMFATGTWFSGGSSTTTKPHFLIEPSGTTSTGWSASGTGIGLNAVSGFTGFLMELQRAAVVKFTVDAGTSGQNNPRVGIGSRPPSEATLFLNTDNTSGTNIDVRTSLDSSSSTVDCQSHDYATNFQSVFLQYSGSAASGNTFTSIPNADLARLIGSGASNFLIGTDTSCPIIFGTNFIERMRISAAGVITFGPDTLEIGYLDIPQVSFSANTTLALSHRGKHLLHPSADTTARVVTIPANSSIAFPVGSAITIINQNAAGVLTISITTDTLRREGTGATGSRTLAANGVATLIKVTTTEWIISGGATLT